MAQILNEMARVGYFDDFEIIIWTDNSGNIPHMHIRDRGTHGDKFHCCIRLDNPEYFSHGGKEDKLNSKQIKSLLNFLKSTSKIGKTEINNWDKVIMYWNDNNSNVILNDDTPIPDYKLLNEDVLI